MVDHPKFSPVSFRAGNWLFQPTRNAALELSRRGLRIDSSVFKGGLQRNHHLDYRPAKKNGYYWPFSSNVNEPDPLGQWLELPIHTENGSAMEDGNLKTHGHGNALGGSRASLHKK